MQGDLEVRQVRLRQIVEVSIPGEVLGQYTQFRLGFSILDTPEKTKKLVTYKQRRIA